MSMHDDIKTVLVSEEQLKAKVAELGGQISQGLVKCSFVGHGQWVQLESGPNLHRF